MIAFTNTSTTPYMVITQLTNQHNSHGFNGGFDGQGDGVYDHYFTASGDQVRAKEGE